MSGGVDSSVAAALLKEQDYEVVGVTMKLWRGEDDPFAAHRYGGCCTIGATEDARRVCDRLDIPYYVVNLQDEFDAAVVDNFVAEYSAGRTPNPCARCNEFIKFAAFLERADELECDFIATGHYAQIREFNGRFALLRGVDRRKDQSYVLGMLTQRELSRTLLPIGHLEKDETRRIAAEIGMCVAAKPDSQEICFVEDGDYAKFVTTRAPQMALAGEIVDSSGAHVGEHHGLAHYTVGQRKGLGIAAPAPLYVTKIDVESNRLVVGPREALGVEGLEARDAKWASVPVQPGARLSAQLRAHSEAAPITVDSADEHRFTVHFDEPYSGVSPGQMCVLYNGNEVVGCGTIQ